MEFPHVLRSLSFPCDVKGAHEPWSLTKPNVFDKNLNDETSNRDVTSLWRAIEISRKGTLCVIGSEIKRE